MSRRALLGRLAAGLASVLLGLAGLLVVPLTTAVSRDTTTFSVGAIAGSVTLAVIAAGLVRPALLVGARRGEPR